jgi:eukaryotic-like serine/threonine-protein kinase
VWNFTEGEEIVDGVLAWKCLGRGERCETWLAWSSRRYAPVVVKLLCTDDLGKANAVSALAREAGLLQRVSHPFLPRLYDDGTAASRPHLMMEYVEGPSLSQMIDEEGPFHPTDVATIGLQLAMALHHLHDVGIAHLDVKPGNAVMRGRRIVLIDLGGSRSIGSPAPPGPAWGTDDYMAPEHAAGQPAAVLSDIYSLGATLAELVTGRWPPAAGDALKWKPRSAAGERLRVAIEALRSADPACRPATARDAMALLRTVRADITPPWPPFVLPDADQPTLRGNCPSRPTLAV